MSDDSYLARPATADDIAAVLDLRTEAEDWLRRRGIQQWTPDYDDYARGVLRDAVDARTAWVIVDGGGQVVATVSLNGADLDFWTADDQPDTGLYLGKMIVARSHAGRQLGDAVMNWASIRAYRAGKRWLRLDCRRDNKRLHAYYLDRGFTHVRTVVPPGRRTESGALFQRPAGQVTGPLLSDVDEDDAGTG
jgi:GNAT superfamily N-acetyltransferase